MSAAISNSELLKSLHWRYAVKKFDASKKISVNDWSTLEQALVLSPSSYGLQPWKFLDIQNPEIRKQLTPVSYGQTQVQDCSHFIVMTHLRNISEEYVRHYMRYTAQLRGMAPEALDGYANIVIGDVVKGPRNKEIDIWASRQVYIAMGNLLTCAALMGIDSCPMEGLDPVAFDKILNLNTSEYKTVAAVALGYRSEQDGYSKAKKSRFEVSKIIHRI